jgi:hypothetical protein
MSRAARWLNSIVVKAGLSRMDEHVLSLNGDAFAVAIAAASTSVRMVASMTENVAHRRWSGSAARHRTPCLVLDVSLRRCGASPQLNVPASGE